MENCVLQCETTGIIVRTSARLTMNMCDLYGSKVGHVFCHHKSLGSSKNLVRDINCQFNELQIVYV